MCFMLMALLMTCIICCCRNRKSNSSTMFGRILLSLPPTLFHTRAPDGIIQPNVMFYTRPPTRQLEETNAIVARALALPSVKVSDRLTTPIMPLNPAYEALQPIKVTTVNAASGSTLNELTLPPGYVVNRDLKYT